MRVLFRPQARTEVMEAQAWYESRATGLGLEFARSVDAAVASAVRDPAAFAPIANDSRRVLLRRFPFSWSIGFAATSSWLWPYFIIVVTRANWFVAQRANSC